MRPHIYFTISAITYAAATIHTNAISSTLDSGAQHLALNTVSESTRDMYLIIGIIGISQLSQNVPQGMRNLTSRGICIWAHSVADIRQGVREDVNLERRRAIWKKLFWCLFQPIFLIIPYRKWGHWIHPLRRC